LSGGAGAEEKKGSAAHDDTASASGLDRAVRGGGRRRGPRVGAEQSTATGVWPYRVLFFFRFAKEVVSLRAQANGFVRGAGFVGCECGKQS